MSSTFFPVSFGRIVIGVILLESVKSQDSFDVCVDSVKWKISGTFFVTRSQLLGVWLVFRLGRNGYASLLAELLLNKTVRGVIMLFRVKCPVTRLLLRRQRCSRRRGRSGCPLVKLEVVQLFAVFNALDIGGQLLNSNRRELCNF